MGEDRGRGEKKEKEGKNERGVRSKEKVGEV
jgi:hypothetical protein